MIVNLGSKKGDKNYQHSTKLTDLHNPLLMRIFYTPENHVSHGEGKSLTREALTSTLKYSFLLFFCSAHDMYNRVHLVQEQHIWLKIYSWS